MKLRLCWVAATIVLLGAPHYAGAATIFETTGWITESTGLTFDFVADTAPFTYNVTLSDLSTGPFFGFEFLFLSITTSTDTVDSIVGPGSFSFTAVPDKKYFANIFGTGGGTMGAGLFGISVVSVPEPGTVLLLAAGVVALVALRRRS